MDAMPPETSGSVHFQMFVRSILVFPTAFKSLQVYCRTSSQSSRGGDALKALSGEAEQTRDIALAASSQAQHLFRKQNVNKKVRK
jgi:hypothetical protein